MRAIIVTALLLATACGPRQVEVRSAPTQTTEVAIHFTNNLAKAVNVYVNAGESDLFIRQVGPNATEHLAVRGIAAGTRVTLKAKPIDGTGGYERQGVTMTDMTTWRIP
ncbi:MAG TPA: hypothetical protein VEB19_05160 [Gemmatimonadaceae bacterium]|nr:hypothetical protein [Gemmatimonadaceae bacterium]